MWQFRISLTIVSTIITFHYLQQHFGQRAQVDCSPLFFFGPPDAANSQQPLIPTTASHLAQQEVHIDSPKSKAEEYLLLTQEEVLNNAQVLRFLEGADKEEIEDLLSQNPTLSDQIYSRINKVVETKMGQHRLLATSSNDPLINQQQQPEASSQANGQLTRPALGMPSIQSIGTGVDNIGPEIAVGAIGMGVLKKKLKPKIAKLIKIGGKLKKKILPLLKKKGKKKKKKVLYQVLNGIYNNRPAVVDEENPEIVFEDDESGEGGDESNDNNPRVSNPLRPRFKFNVST